LGGLLSDEVDIGCAETQPRHPWPESCSRGEKAGRAERRPCVASRHHALLLVARRTEPRGRPLASASNGVATGRFLGIWRGEVSVSHKCATCSTRSHSIPPNLG
jgi:hypothetical protein